MCAQSIQNVSISVGSPDTVAKLASIATTYSTEHCLPQRVFRSPQTPNIIPYSTFKMALLCVLYILQDAQFISAGANSATEYIMEWDRETGPSWHDERVNALFISTLVELISTKDVSLKYIYM